jgi:hypothetical protein
MVFKKRKIGEIMGKDIFVKASSEYDFSEEKERLREMLESDFENIYSLSGRIVVRDEEKIVSLILKMRD